MYTKGSKQMIQLIVGSKGSGKTKKLLQMVREAASISKGNVVCIEKGESLRFDLSHDIRLINIEEYRIKNAQAYYGFIAGLMAGNYDITDIFGDATFKIICGKDIKDTEILAGFVETLNTLIPDSVKVTLTVSCDMGDIPERIAKYIAN